MECYFSIDKNKALDIMRAIQSTSKQQGEESEEDWPACYEHKLAVVELYLPDANHSDNIENFYDEIIAESHKGEEEGYSRSESIDIVNIKINNSNIELDAYLHGTSAECDWSYPKFSYDERLKTWIICDSGWDAPNGIGGNGAVTILDFNNYK